MSCITKSVSRYVKEKRINITGMSRDTGVPYSALYASLCDEERGRSLRDDELVAVCRFLGVNPMDFADESEKGDDR